MSEQVVKTIQDRQSSIEVGLNAKREYIWNVKVYFNEEQYSETLDRVVDIENFLRKEYGNKKPVEV